MNSIIEDNNTSIIKLRKQHNIDNLYAFGSVVQDAFTKSTYVNFLYEVDIENFKAWVNGEYDYSKPVKLPESIAKFIKMKS